MASELRRSLQRWCWALLLGGTIGYFAPSDFVAIFGGVMAGVLIDPMEPLRDASRGKTPVEKG